MGRHMNPARAAALSQGLTQFSTGKPCRNGHTANRFAYNNVCTACSSANAHRWQKANPEQTREWKRDSYYRHREKKIEYGAKYRAERVEQYKDYYRNNMVAYKTRGRNRKRKVLQATPPWVNFDEIMAVFQSRRRSHGTDRHPTRGRPYHPVDGQERQRPARPLEPARHPQTRKPGKEQPPPRLSPPILGRRSLRGCGVPNSTPERPHRASIQLITSPCDWSQPRPRAFSCNSISRSRTALSFFVSAASSCRAHAIHGRRWLRPSLISGSARSTRSSRLFGCNGSNIASSAWKPSSGAV